MKLILLFTQIIMFITIMHIVRDYYIIKYSLGMRYILVLYPYRARVVISSLLY